MNRSGKPRAATEDGNVYASDFFCFEKSAGGKGPSWLMALRREAIERFGTFGFPTTKEENWKYTNIAPLVKIPFHWINGVLRTSVTTKDVEQAGFGASDSIRLVFVNGRYKRALSSPGKTMGPVIVESLAKILAIEPAQIQPYLEHPVYRGSAFRALNTAFLNDGAYVHIPKGSVVPGLIHLLFISTAEPERPTVSHPRNLIVAEAGSQATIIESYVGLGSEIYFTNAYTEIIAAENAIIDHYRLQRESQGAFHVGALEIHQGRNSQVSSFSLSLGAALSRNDVNTLLAGEGGDLALNGLYLVGGRQLADNHTVIDHATPHCNSRELYLGLLDGKSRGVFDGKIFVRPDAQKTVARQTNKNLLLSKEALVNTKPQLEINADDVKCNHGATIGQLNEDALFYLRSRGIGENQARSVLTYAFANEVVNLIRVDPVRQWLESLLLDRLERV